MKLLITQEWLERKLAEDPDDGDCAAGPVLGFWRMDEGDLRRLWPEDGAPKSPGRDPKDPT